MRQDGDPAAEQPPTRHVHHHGQTDNLWQAIEISERIAHGLKLPRRARAASVPAEVKHDWAARLQQKVSAWRMANHDKISPEGSHQFLAEYFYSHLRADLGYAAAACDIARYMSLQDRGRAAFRKVFFRNEGGRLHACVDWRPGQERAGPRRPAGVDRALRGGERLHGRSRAPGGRERQGRRRARAPADSAQGAGAGQEARLLDRGGEARPLVATCTSSAV
jgi:hypothetical protein